MLNPFKMFTRLITSQPFHGYAWGATDDADLPIVSRAIYVGTFGDVRVTYAGGETETYVGVTGRLSGEFTKIWKTGTTASNIIVEW